MGQLWLSPCVHRRPPKMLTKVVPDPGPLVELPLSVEEAELPLARVIPSVDAFDLAGWGCVRRSGERRGAEANAAFAGEEGRGSRDDEEGDLARPVFGLLKGVRKVRRVLLAPWLQRLQVRQVERVERVVDLEHGERGSSGCRARACAGVMR